MSNLPTNHTLSFSGKIEVEISGQYDIQGFHDLMEGWEDLDISNVHELHNFMYDALGDTILDVVYNKEYDFSATDLTYKLDNGKDVNFDILVKGINEILENQPKQHKYHEQ